MLPDHSGAEPDAPWSFREETRCCTFEPIVPTSWWGVRFARGGVSAEKVRARLQGEGVTALGISPSPAFRARYEARRALGFGRDVSLRCPYFVGGEHACGIWNDRSSTCRTWFCKHEEGVAGAMRWWHLDEATTMLERELALFCLRKARAPRAGASTDELITWFIACAARIDAFDAAADVASINLRPLLQPRAALARQALQPSPSTLPLPNAIEPSVSEVFEEGDEVRVVGYSTYDSVVAPRAIFCVSRPSRWRSRLASDTTRGGRATRRRSQ